MTHLEKLEQHSIYLIREAYARQRHLAMLWSMGKDSTTLLWLCRKAFFGKIPFPVVHLDTGFKFSQMYDYREHYKNEWDLNLIVGKNEQALKEGVKCQPQNTSICCQRLKTDNLKAIMDEHKFKGLLVAIRRDEHGIRAKERVFSPRQGNFSWNYKDQPLELWDQYAKHDTNDAHLRIHPLLDWQEIDIWKYIRKERIPIIDMYFAKEGKRYRSLGCYPCTSPVDSHADNLDKIIEELESTTVSERSGRALDKERAYAMQKLRSLGYM